MTEEHPRAEDPERRPAVAVTRRTKLWLGLGAFVTLGGADGALAQPAPAPAATQGGEGGEGGEGGVDPERAATDPVAYLLALEIVAAHYLVGRGVYAAGEAQAAAELFAHPVAEVYVALEPVFEARGVPPFREAMEAATTLALDRKPQAEVMAAVDAVLAALDGAARKAPGAGATLGVRARILGELVDRAALQYAIALRSPEREPYLDGVGFFLAARAGAERVLPALDAAGRRKEAEAIRGALGALARAYPGLAPPAPPLDPGPLTAQSARLKIVLEDLR